MNKIPGRRQMMIKSYFKTSFRTLSNNKTYTFLNITGLGLGLTGSVLIFLFVKFHLSTDTFHRHADRIYRLVLDIHLEDGSIEHEPGTSVAMIDALKNDYTQVEKTAMCMFFYTPPTLAVQTSPDQWQHFVEPQGVAYGNTDLLHMFDFVWMAGDKKAALDEPHQVVLSQRQANKYFGSTDVLGKTLRINGQTDLIVSGIIETPPINTDLAIDVLVSLPTLKIINPAYQLDNYSWFGHNNWLFVQLQQGAEASLLDQQLTGFVQKYLGESFSHWQLHLQPLAQMHFDKRYDGKINKSLLYMLGLTGVMLILVACINFINLSTAQATRRAKEMGVRKVMGSTQQQLFWQFITETACITFCSVVLAIVAILLILPTLNHWLKTTLSLSLIATPSMVIFLMLLILVLIMMAGSYPAVILSGFNPVTVLKSRIAAPGNRGLSIRKVLVVLQFAISQIFAISALMIMYQMHYLRNTDMGFSKNAVITVSLPKFSQSHLETFRHKLTRYPVIEEVSFHHRPPIADMNDGGYIKFDQRENWESFIVRDRWADAHFLATYDLQLIAGRNIQERDSITEFLVNEEFVRKLNLAEPEEVLNKTMVDGNAHVTGTIVGVVKDFHHRPLQYAIEPLAIYAYPSLFRQAGIRFNTHNISQVLQIIQDTWYKTFPDHVFEYAFVDETIAKMYETEETISHLTKIFAIATMIICFLGLYGLVLFITAQRTREIGIRKVLGASASSILLLLSNSYIKLMLIALLIACPIANFFIKEWLQNFAYHIEVQWWMFILPGIVVLLLALFSVSKQTVKAARQNPVDSLRYE